MASFLTLPQELRDQIIDLLHLTNNAQPKNLPEYYTYEQAWPHFAIPRPKKHHTAGLCQASHQLRIETLRRSSSLHLGLRYTLCVVIHRRETSSSFKLEPRLRWIDTPIISATNIDRLDIHFELNDLYHWGWGMTTQHRGIVGSLLKDTVYAVIFGCGRTGFKRTINKINIEITAKESQALDSYRIRVKCDNALEILEKYLSEGGQEFADFCIATAIKYDCLGCVNLVEYTDAQPASLLPAPRNMFWTQIGSVSLQAGTAVPKKTWYVDRKLLDRMKTTEDPKYLELIPEILLRRDRDGLDRESKLAEDHYEDPESVVLHGNLDRCRGRAKIGVRIWKYWPGKGHVERLYIRTWSLPVKFDYFFNFWKNCRETKGIMRAMDVAWERWERRERR